MILQQRDKDIMRFIEEYKGITISQCSKIFYPKNRYKYDEARRRLKKLFNSGYIKKYKNDNTSEVIYHFDKSISPHDIKLLDFYAELINQGCQILNFTKEKKWLDGKVRVDGYFEVAYNESIKYLIVEVDFTHQTVIKKFKDVLQSEEFYNEHPEFHDIENGEMIFPKICIVCHNDNKTYNDEFLNVTFLDWDLNNFTQKALVD